MENEKNKLFSTNDFTFLLFHFEFRLAIKMQNVKWKMKKINFSTNDFTFLLFHFEF